MNIYQIDDDFLTRMYERIQAAIAEASNDSVFRATILPRAFANELATKISKNTIAALVERSLWASLEREEGQFHPFSLVVEPPDVDKLTSHYTFARAIDLTATNLAKFAPALDATNYHIGVWFSADGQPRIWGFRTKLIWFLSINSISPGKVSLGCMSGTKASFKCLISIPQAGFLNPVSREANPIFGWLSNEEIITLIHKSTDLNAIFSKMFHHGYGGTMLLVPDDQNNWKASVQEPIRYEHCDAAGYEYPELLAKYRGTGELESILRSKPKNGSRLERLKDQLLRAIEKAKGTIDDIYKLTTVDGATVLSRNIRVLGFGVKIVTQTEIENIAVSEPFEDSRPVVQDLANWNVGTRHKSAANFVNEQRDCLAVVASEDRELSVFSWSNRYGSVHQLKGFELFVLG